MHPLYGTHLMSVPDQDVSVPLHRDRTRRETGYLHPSYWASLAEFGRPAPLPNSGAWLLVRRIPKSGEQDAFAGYPRLICPDWSQLADDLKEHQDVVSVVAVTDAFAEVSRAVLTASFPALVRPYKSHFLIETERAKPSGHHRRKVRRALQSVVVVADDSSTAHLDVWEALYGDLRLRHSLSGLHALSRTAFQEQLSVPGSVFIRAMIGERCVSATLWYVMGDVAYYHLGASHPDGYAVSASYALIARAIDVLGSRGVTWLDLGAYAGRRYDPADGLSRFKRGWSSEMAPTYLCGRVNDEVAYRELVAGTPGATEEFFPAYRGS